MNNKRISIIAVLVVVLASILVLSSSEAPKKKEQAARSESRSGVMRTPVRGVVITPRSLDNKIFATGNIIAMEEVELRSEVSGKVIKIAFKEGSHVKKGDLLVKINDSELKAQLEKAQSKSKLVEEKEFRQRQLRERSLISQEVYDEVKNELNSIRADMELLHAQLQKTEIRASYNGVVGLRYVSEGSYISPQTLIARLQDIGSVKIDFSIPEKYAPMVQKGNKVRFSVEGSSKQHEGTVYAIEPKIDPVTRTLRLRALARNEREAILPGSFAKVELILKREQDAVLVPTFAVIPDIEGQKVFVAKNGIATLVKIETGIRTEEQIHVMRGLQANDTVIVTGLLQLKPGSPVAVTVDK